MQPKNKETIYVQKICDVYSYSVSVASSETLRFRLLWNRCIEVCSPNDTVSCYVATVFILCCVFVRLLL